MSFVHPRELVSFVHSRELVSFVHPRELVSFVHPRELVSFDPQHVTRFPPIRKLFELEGITKRSEVNFFLKKTFLLKVKPGR